MLARELTLVEIEADDGHKGIGFTYGGNRVGGIVTAAVRTLLGPMLIGEAPYRVEGLWEAMYQEALLQGRTGSVMRGVSVCPHAYHEMHLQLATSTPNALFVEVFTYDKIVNFRRLLDTKPAFEGGWVILPDRPGLDMITCRMWSWNTLSTHGPKRVPRRRYP